LIYTYPLDKKTKEGTLFWTLPKRPPKEIIFDPKNSLHANFIASFAYLWAKIWNIPLPLNPRMDQTKLEIA